MSDPDNFHSSLIRDLGGKAKLADALGLDRDVLTKWHVRGIPSKYWHRVIVLAAACETKRSVTAADLERTKPDTVRAITAEATP
jgi:hypothetical protein